MDNTNDTPIEVPTLDQLKAAVEEAKGIEAVAKEAFEVADTAYRDGYKVGPPVDPENVACPTCKAKAGDGCRTRARRKNTNHTERMTARRTTPEYEAWQAELKALAKSQEDANHAHYKAQDAVRAATDALMTADREETARKRMESLNPDKVQLTVYRGHGDRTLDSYCVVEVRNSTAIMPGSWVPKAQVERAIQRGVQVVFVEEPRSSWGHGFPPPMLYHHGRF